MRRFIFPALLAVAAGLAFLPSHAQASWLSEALHQARGDNYPGYYTPNYGYAPGYYGSPVYPDYSSSYYYAPSTPYYGPSYYTPPAYNYAPSYQDAPYSGYPSYYPRYNNEWRGNDGRRQHEEHEHYEHRR